MKKMFALLLAAVMILSMTACGQKEQKSKLEQIKEAGKLVVGTSADYPPFEFHTDIDGKDTIVGIDITMCQYIANDLGVALEVVDMNFDNLIMSLQKGEFDIIAACMSADEQRLKSVDFSDVVYNTDTVMVTLKENADQFKTPEDLSGHTVCAQTGSAPLQKAMEFAGEENAVGLAKLQDLVMEVKNGKVEGALMDELVAYAYISANPELAVCDFRFERTEYSGIRIGVQKGNEDLVQYLNQVNEKMIQDDVISKATLEAQALAGME